MIVTKSMAAIVAVPVMVVVWPPSSVTVARDRVASWGFV